MLLILVILCLSKSTIVAAPTDPTTSGLILAQQTSTPQVLCPYQHRTLWDIVKSCLVTIFACSWVSIHPNIPPPNEKWWMGPLRRLELMVWAIVAPELIILWATRQWIGARKLEKANKRRLGWTKTHGHFYQMGGFRDFGDPSECPRMTKKEIQDLGKADVLSKALVIIQTLWFITQCIVRRVEGLYITELELATAAFATLNGVMYFLWWDKPLGVQCSVRRQSFDEPQTDSETRSKPFTFSVSDMFFGVFGRIAEIIMTESQDSIFYAHPSAGDLDSFAGVGAGAGEWASVAALLFGGIHCAGWVFHFPSHTELIIWRVSSIVITSLPLLPLLLFVFEDILFFSLTLVGLPFYIVGRLALQVVAFTTLRDLPPGAYEVVRWTTFIPHI